MVGMSAAIRLPLRTLANPALVARETSKASSVGASSNLVANSLRKTLSPSRSITQPWSPRPYEPITRAALSRRCFATRTSPLLTAETNSQQNNGPKVKPARSRKVIVYLIALGVLGAGAVAYSDQIKHGYQAARRSGRVVGTLALCINE